MSYFTPFGKAFLPALTERDNRAYRSDAPYVNSPRGILIDLFPELATQLQRQERRSSFMQMLEDLHQESFPMVSDSSELDHTYVVNVPEITTENDIRIDVSEDKKQIDVTIEVKREDEKTNAVETMHYSWRSAREIDIDNMEAFLDKENNQLSIYSPYVVEDGPEEESLEQPTDPIVNIAINKGNDDNCDCDSNCREDDASCCDSDDECEHCKVEEQEENDSSEETDA